MYIQFRGSGRLDIYLMTSQLPRRLAGGAVTGFRARPRAAQQNLLLTCAPRVADTAFLRCSTVHTGL